MTMIGLATRPSDESDPRRTQKRVATSPSGRTVLIDITGDDRLRILKEGLARQGAPSGWADVMIARERGETLDQISRKFKVQPPCNPCKYKRVPQRSTDGDTIATEEVHIGDPCLAYYMARIYAWWETALHNLADSRARLMP